MPFSARQVRASLQRNSAVIQGVHGLGCAGCGGGCGMGDYDPSTDYSTLSAPDIPGGYGSIDPVDVYIPPAPSGSSYAPLTSVLTSLTNAAATRLAVPQLNPGQSITKLANGSEVLTQQAQGYPLGASTANLGLNASGDSGMLLLLGGLALVFVMGSKK